MTSILLVIAGLTGGLFFYSQDVVRRATADYPPIGSFVEVDGLKLHYVDSAPGDRQRQTIVLVHGASGNLRDFTVSIFDQLAKQYRVIAVDRPGHGYSQRPTLDGAGEWVTPAVQAELIHGALTALDVHDPIVVGHSWGGSVVLAYALAFPDQTAGVVVLSGASYPWRGETAFHHRWTAIPVVGDLFVNLLVAPAFSLVSPAAVERNFAPNRPPENYAHSIGLPLLVRPGNWRANSEDMRHLAAFLAEQKKRYSTINLPMTILTGGSDMSVSPEVHSLRLHDAVSGSQLVVLPDTGHAPHHARSDEVVAAIAALADRIEAGG